MIEIRNKNEKIKNKDGRNYCHHFPIFLLLGANIYILLLHMAKNILWVHKTSELINEFAIVYMINPSFHVNEVFKEKVEKFMNNMFGTLTQPFIFIIMKKRIPLY